MAIRSEWRRVRGELGHRQDRASNQNRLPSPGPKLSTWISLPMRCTSWRLIISPRPAPARRRTSPTRPKRQEELGQLLRRHSDAGILHLEAAGAPGLVLGQHLHPKLHPPLIGEFHRVAQEVEQHLAQALLVGQHRAWGRWGVTS